MKDILKIDNSLEDPSLLIKTVSQTIKNKTKEQTGRFPGLSGESLVGSMLAGKDVVRPSNGNVQAGDRVIKPGNKVVRAAQDF